MTKPFSLRFLLATSISSLALILIALATWTIGQAGARRVEAEIGASMRLQADQMQDKLDRALFRRYREIGIAARMLPFVRDGGREDGVRIWFDELRESNANYAWIGVTDPNGTVTAATDQGSVGQNASSQSWFVAAAKGEAFGELSDGVLPSRGSPGRSPASGRPVYISAPIFNASGISTGVVGAILDWGWVDEVKESLFGNAVNGRTEELIILNTAGHVLIGPSELAGTTLKLKSVDAALRGGNHFASEQWPDGGTYVTGYARSDGYADFAGLGWIVLVRQDSEQALAPVRALQRQTLTWGAFLAGLAAIAAWLLAHQISTPLLRLANTADAVRRDPDIPIPPIHAYAEAATLSKSLDSMVTELKLRQRALASLNETLEAQVVERTAELARQNSALVVAREEAEEATAAKSRFLAAASHDLRQPLHAMNLFARALSRRVAGDEATRLVSQLEASLSSLKEMFDALLNVSRLDAGLIEVNAGSVAVPVFMERIATGFRAEASHRGLKFTCRTVDAEIVTDPVLLETILRNLLSNALKFTKRGGIVFSARRDGGRLAFDVFDTGAGIDPNRQARIFQEFERSKEHATGANDGLGLGLSIVRRYARMLGIELRLVSRPGRGTRFTLLIPIVSMASESRSADAHARPSQLALLSGARVAIVDDDPQIVAAMERELTDRGCTALTFKSIHDAREQLGNGLAIDAAVVDFDLGEGVTGPTLLAAVEKKRGGAVFALILTGGTDATTLKTVMQTGRPWLTKPADPDSVAQALASLLSQVKPMS